MEKNFNSQICTTLEQSKKLLELGLKPETADMYHTTFYRDNVGYEIIQVRNEKLPLLSQELPAWSLHRLMEIAKMDWFNSVATAYDEVISVITFQHGEGYINKEYLKQ